MSDSIPLLGFLTITENSRFGLIGGYLLLNTSGRPIEFHCTTPVRATRAQEILYGATLRPFLCGEQIAVTLIHKSKTEPVLLITDIPAVLAAQNMINMPLSCVDEETEEPGSLDDQIADVPGLEKNDWEITNIQRKEVALPNFPKFSRSELVAQLEMVASHIDLCEPFERIRLALEEAQKAA